MSLFIIFFRSQGGEAATTHKAVRDRVGPREGAGGFRHLSKWAGARAAPAAARGEKILIFILFFYL